MQWHVFIFKRALSIHFMSYFLNKNIVHNLANKHNFFFKFFGVFPSIFFYFFFHFERAQNLSNSWWNFYMHEFIKTVNVLFFSYCTWMFGLSREWGGGYLLCFFSLSLFLLAFFKKCSTFTLKSIRKNAHTHKFPSFRFQRLVKESRATVRRLFASMCECVVDKVLYCMCVLLIKRLDLIGSGIRYICIAFYRHCSNLHAQYITFCCCYCRYCCHKPRVQIWSVKTTTITTKNRKKLKVFILLRLHACTYACLMQPSV